MIWYSICTRHPSGEHHYRAKSRIRLEYQNIHDGGGGRQNRIEISRGLFFHPKLSLEKRCASSCCALASAAVVFLASTTLYTFKHACEKRRHRITLHAIREPLLRFIIVHEEDEEEEAAVLKKRKLDAGKA